MRALIRAGADVAAQGDGRQLSALHGAAAIGDLPTIAELLRAGAHIDARDSTNRTALHLASAAGHVSAITELIKQGADIEARDTVGWTPRRTAAARGRREAVDALRQAGAQPSWAVARWVKRIKAGLRKRLVLMWS